MKTCIDRNFNGWWCPERCPITLLPFFMWIEHPEHGWLPTYGGPYDSYTIPEPDIDDLCTVARHEVDYCRLRYDHDQGAWRLDEVESVWERVVSEQLIFDWLEGYEFAQQLQRLIADQSEWSQATFGSDQERGPVGGLRHLAKEAREAEEAYERNEPEALKVELADCLLLELDAIRRSGFTLEEIIEAGFEKMKVNRARTYPRPTSDDPVEHIDHRGK